MWGFLVFLGILIVLAGCALIALGVSIFVTTFGNTLITTGAVAASGGFVITAPVVMSVLPKVVTKIDTPSAMRDRKSVV